MYCNTKFGEKCCSYSTTPLNPDIQKYWYISAIQKCTRCTNGLSRRCSSIVCPSLVFTGSNIVAKIYVILSPIWSYILHHGWSVNMDWTNHIDHPTHTYFTWYCLYFFLFVCSLNQCCCLFPKFQKLFSFTWSSFHVYGSLLSNQIEASNSHKNGIVWHLPLKSNICMATTNIGVSSLRFVW